MKTILEDHSREQRTHLEDIEKLKKENESLKVKSKDFSVFGTMKADMKKVRQANKEYRDTISTLNHELIESNNKKK